MHLLRLDLTEQHVVSANPHIKSVFRWLTSSSDDTASSSSSSSSSDSFFAFFLGAAFFAAAFFGGAFSLTCMSSNGLSVSETNETSKTDRPETDRLLLGRRLGLLLVRLAVLLLGRLWLLHRSRLATTGSMMSVTAECTSRQVVGEVWAHLLLFCRRRAVLVAVLRIVRLARRLGDVCNGIHNIESAESSDDQSSRNAPSSATEWQHEGYNL